MRIEGRFLLLSVVLLLVAAGCGRTPKGSEITDLQRKEAALLMSEADFAISLRDFARAEAALAKAVELTPDNGGYWISLGGLRKRMGNASGARAAYQAALRTYEGQAKEDKLDPQPWLKQIHVLALLGRTDDARALVERTVKQFPADRLVRIFVEEKQFEQMLAAPGFKDVAL
jgi:tetratricopeptide (TPR) repeat protein